MRAAALKCCAQRLVLLGISSSLVPCFVCFAAFVARPCGVPRDLLLQLLRRPRVRPAPRRQGGGPQPSFVEMLSSTSGRHLRYLGEDGPLFQERRGRCRTSHACLAWCVAQSTDNGTASQRSMPEWARADHVGPSCRCPRRSSRPILRQVQVSGLLRSAMSAETASVLPSTRRLGGSAEDFVRLGTPVKVMTTTLHWSGPNALLFVVQSDVAIVSYKWFES